MIKTSLKIVFLIVVLGFASLFILFSSEPGVIEFTGKNTLLQTQLVERNATTWPTYGGQATSTQYSALEQINLDNIDELGVAWTYQTGHVSAGTEDADLTTFQVTPIYANNSLYLCTPFSHIVSLDPATGEPQWSFNPKRKLTDTFYGTNYCRGVSYWESTNVDERQQSCGKRIYQSVMFGTLIAVDADTGKLCEGFGNGGRVELNDFDYHGIGKVYSTSPPAIYEDIVIVGGSIYDGREGNAPDGIVRGFDARTGDEVWSWNPIPAHLSDTVGAANAWAPLSIDQKNGLVFLPTSSPSYDLLGTVRTEPIPDGNAVVALAAESGEKRWSFQTIRHDLWDYDLASAPTLATITKAGRNQDVVIQATKQGFVFVLDRLTGEPVFPVDEFPAPASDILGEYTSPTQPKPRLPAPITSTHLDADHWWSKLMFCGATLAGLKNDGLFTPPSLAGSVLHPSFLGGTNWGGLAYDQESGLAVVNSSNLVASVTLVPVEEYDAELHRPQGFSKYPMNGSPYVGIRGVLQSPFGLETRRSPCNPPPWGNLTAIDMKTGETRWQIPFGQIDIMGPLKSPAIWGTPNMGGPIVTRGGLIFIGASPDNLMRAYNLYTGKLVWKGKTAAPAMATPMTYEHDGKQYVVVAAGGHDSFVTDISDTVIAFSLPTP